MIDCKLQGVLVEEKRDREELRGGIPVEEKRGKEELRLQICYFLRRILGVVLHTGEKVSRTKKMGFAGSRVMEVVIKQSGGLVWKNWPMNHTRRANAKKRHVRLRQVESVLKACAGPAPSKKTQNCSTESTDSQPSASQ